MNLLSFSPLINHLITVKTKKKRVHLCPHCKKRWGEDYLALLCYKRDLEKLGKLIFIIYDNSIAPGGDGRKVIEEIQSTE